MFVDAHGGADGLFGNSSQREPFPKKEGVDDKAFQCYPAILLWFTSALVLRCLRRTGSIR